MATRTSADFSRLITNSSISLTFDGKTYTVRKDDGATYNLLLEAIKEGRWDDVPNLVNPSKVIETLSQGKMEVVDGQVYITDDNGDRFSVPQRLNDTILMYKEQNLPFDGLIAFATKLQQNPSFSSVQQAFTFLEAHRFTLTDSGNIIAYKKVRDDMTDCYSGKFNNNIGEIVTMDRANVTEDPDSYCSQGLHCSNFEYAASFYGGAGSGKLIIVEVNPADLVSIPRDHGCAKIRVCKYIVKGICQGEFFKPIYDTTQSFESNYEDLDFCEVCDLALIDCECNVCEECGEIADDCFCDSCDDCGNFEENCDCNIDDINSDHE